MSLSFVITTFIDSDLKLKHFLKCVQSIFDYASFNFIYIINNSNDNYDNQHLKRYFLCDNKIKFIEVNKKINYLQSFYYILQFTENSDYYFIIHDNMYLHKKFSISNSNENDIQFISYPLYIQDETNNEIDNELDDEYIDIYSINYILNEYFNKDKDFLKYALNNINEKLVSYNSYACLITKEAIKKINNATNFANIFLLFNDNKKKIASEYIFALLCNYYFCI
jgi:hypothetical protein